MTEEVQCGRTKGFVRSAESAEDVGTRAGQALDAVDTGYNVVGSCKRPWIWKSEDGRSWPMPCGKCLACRIRRRSVWTIRMLHEIHKAERACFITLTYDEEHLPVRGNDSRGILVKSDLQNFFKRLRKALKDADLKYYACGEYGDSGGRPHYHAILFGVVVDETTLGEIWKMGRVDVGEATEASVRYVAGYVSKKLGLSDYNHPGRPAPFQVSSQGIGMRWAEENMLQVLLDGFLTFRGKRLPVPRAYLKKYEVLFPEAMDGFSSRLAFASDLALTDKILEMAPEYGGRSWIELTDAERENVLIQLHKRGDVIDADLRAREHMRDYKL